MSRPLAIDLFAGAGGLSYGLESAGFDVVASLEIEAIHAAVHEYNFAYGRTICADIRTVDAATIRERAGLSADDEITLVAGGPPCQGISLMGRRAIDDPRNELLAEFVRVVLDLRPRFVIMENVAGLLAGEHARLLDEVADDLEAGGYRVRRPIRVLQAAEFGVAQSRKRLFLLAAAAGESLPDYPAPTHQARSIRPSGPLPTSDRTATMSVSQALAGLCDADEFDELLTDDALRVNDAITSPIAQGEFARVRADDPFVLTSSRRTIHTPATLARFAATAPGQVEPVSRFLRLHPDGVSNTLRAGTGSSHGGHTAARPIHPSFDRVLTVREGARLHGYPDTFRFASTKWSGFREVGNSVPPPLARAVAGAVLDAAGITPTRGPFTPTGDPAWLSCSLAQARALLDRT